MFPKKYFTAKSTISIAETPSIVYIFQFFYRFLLKDSISFSFKILQSLDLPVLNLPVDLLAPLEFFGFRCLETKIFISWQLKVDTLAKTSSCKSFDDNTVSA